MIAIILSWVGNAIVLFIAVFPVFIISQITKNSIRWAMYWSGYCNFTFGEKLELKLVSFERKYPKKERTYANYQKHLKQEKEKLDAEVREIMDEFAKKNLEKRKKKLDGSRKAINKIEHTRKKYIS